MIAASLRSRHAPSLRSQRPVVEWTQEIRLRSMQPTIRRFRFSNVPRVLLLWVSKWRQLVAGHDRLPQSVTKRQSLAPSDSRTKRPEVESRSKEGFPCQARPSRPGTFSSSPGVQFEEEGLLIRSQMPRAKTALAARRRSRGGHIAKVIGRKSLSDDSGGRNVEKVPAPESLSTPGRFRYDFGVPGVISNVLNGVQEVLGSNPSAPTSLSLGRLCDMRHPNRGSIS
jgi:hypothetical protein